MLEKFISGFFIVGSLFLFAAHVDAATETSTQIVIETPAE